MPATSTLPFGPRLDPDARAPGGDPLGLYAVMGAITSGLLGAMGLGVALGAGWIAMPWSRAFATGLLGGAAIGFIVGAAVGLVRRFLAPPPVEPISTAAPRAARAPRVAARARRRVLAARG